MSSKAITSAPLSITRENSDSAASGDGTATKAVSTRLSAGTRRRAAAVMMPSVPFPAEEQVAQRVAGIVLAHAPQVVQHAAIGQHDLQAQHQVPRIAPAQGADAAGIGGQHAADHRRALRAPREREQPVHPCGGLLHVLDDAAGLGDQGEVARIDIADAVHAFEAEHHRGGPLAGTTAPPHSPVRPPAGTTREAGGGAGAQGRGDFLGAAGAQHGGRGAVPGAAPIHRIGGDVLRLGQAVARAERCGQVVERFHGRDPAPAAAAVKPAGSRAGRPRASPRNRCG